MFNGIIPETFGMKKFKPNRNSFPEFDENGWRGKIFKTCLWFKIKKIKNNLRITFKWIFIFSKNFG